MTTLGKRYVLLVDDDAITLKVLAHHVNSFLNGGIEVLSIRNGELAIQEVKKIINNGDHLICAVVDYYMNPIMGSDVLFEIDNIAPRSKKILLTGAADLRAVTGVIENIQLFRYITKPWQLHDLELTIKEAIRMYLYEVEIIERNLELEKIKESLEITVRERTEELRRKNEELEQGLQYARTIQECFLPDASDAPDYLKNLTIYNAPANGISGDFIWYRKVNDKILVALGDSTGHGLAGALITVLATDILSTKTHMAEEKDGLYRMVSQSISELRGRLTKELNTNNGCIGVDLAILYIDPHEGIMDWASLNGNIILVDSQNNVEILSKARGFVHLPNYQERIFHGRANVKNKFVAIFSDGIYDQINPALGKRMKFNGLVNNIEQGLVFSGDYCLIENFFLNWKKNSEQTDDALWLSFKV
jgi:sigma-B regulation protein RsbU (phosphoserine phosphatase)